MDFKICLTPKIHGFLISAQSYNFSPRLAQLDNLDFTLSHTVSKNAAYEQVAIVSSEQPDPILDHHDATDRRHHTAGEELPSPQEGSAEPEAHLVRKEAALHDDDVLDQAVLPGPH